MFSWRGLQRRIRQERLASFSAWRDRAVIWVAAAVAGLCIVGFTYLTDEAVAGFLAMRKLCLWAPFLVTPLGGMAVVWLTRRWAPGSAGSGIPQVMAAVEPVVPVDQVSMFVSLRLSVAKAVLGATGLLAGFSAGREGPSVQIAAGVMHTFRRAFSSKSVINSRDLILVGGAAGMAAAFNAPLAGVVFAIEELSRRFEQRSSGLLITAIVLAGLVSVSIEGNYTYFGHLNGSALNISMLVPALMCTAVAGMGGGLFSRVLIRSTAGERSLVSRFRHRHPVLFAGCCGLGVAGLGWISKGAAHGSGYIYARDMLSQGFVAPFVYVPVKLCATWLSYWSGIPGGIFAPALSIGAGLGSDVALAFHIEHASPLIALGMVAFLAAVTQAPITSFIIVMEMIDGHSMVLSLMAAALAASLLSRLFSPALYPALCELQLKRVQAAL